MTRRMTGRFMILLLCAAMLGLYTVAAQAEGGIATWEELRAAISSGGRITLTQDIIDRKVGDDSYRDIKSILKNNDIKEVDGKTITMFSPLFLVFARYNSSSLSDDAIRYATATMRYYQAFMSLER